MSCIPVSGGCERWATDALAETINDLEGTHYEFRACLDHDDRTRSQPECLYTNVDDGRSLVVERKSISWPESYAYGHSKDHDLADAISAHLAGVVFRDVYHLKMPGLSGGSKQEVRALAGLVAEEIRLRHVTLRYGEVRRIECGGRTFEFGIRPVDEREDGDPASGLVFVWPIQAVFSDRDNLQEKVRRQIEKVFAACIRKFADYSDARRVLMLDPHGEIQYFDAKWWNELFKNRQPPPAINEIWIGHHGWNDWGEEEWVIEKAFGAGFQPPDLLPIPVSD
jgi:hypothetical protein